MITIKEMCGKCGIYKDMCRSYRMCDNKKCNNIEGLCVEGKNQHIKSSMIFSATI